MEYTNKIVNVKEQDPEQVQAVGERQIRWVREQHRQLGINLTSVLLTFERLQK